MKYIKSHLIYLTQKIEENKKLAPDEIDYILNFEKKDKPTRIKQYLQQSALPLSLAFGFFFSVFPETFSQYINKMPSWTNMPPHILAGVDYLWNLLGEPVEEANILYHIPNIILYSFGIFGIKKLFDALDKRTWLDRVLAAQTALRLQLTNGVTSFRLKKGHSLLFIGKGDFIGMQFVLSHEPEKAVTVSETKPAYTKIWNYYSADTLFDDLKKVAERCDGRTAGEYIFFPVKDDQIFLPAPTAYDLAPHKLDILCQNIRTIEKTNKWKSKRIIIVGDKYHKSFVRSEDKKGTLSDTEEVISLESIAKKYDNIILLDPTDIVLKYILKIAKGRKIVFRATHEGIAEFKSRFYHRLEELGYKQPTAKKGVLTIGHDIFEDLKEQQMLSRKIDDYFPIVLSKNVYDALIRNGYKRNEFIYVPELVLKTISKEASQQ